MHRRDSTFVNTVIEVLGAAAHGQGRLDFLRSAR